MNCLGIVFANTSLAFLVAFNQQSMIGLEQVLVRDTCYHPNHNPRYEILGLVLPVYVLGRSIDNVANRPGPGDCNVFNDFRSAMTPACDTCAKVACDHRSSSLS